MLDGLLRFAISPFWAHRRGSGETLGESGDARAAFVASCMKDSVRGRQACTWGAESVTGACLRRITATDYRYGLLLAPTANTLCPRQGYCRRGFLFQGAAGHPAPVPSSDMGRIRRKAKAEKGGGVGIGGSGEGVNSLGGPMDALLALLLALKMYKCHITLILTTVLLQLSGFQSEPTDKFVIRHLRISCNCTRRPCR